MAKWPVPSSRACANACPGASGLGLKRSIGESLRGDLGELGDLGPVGVRALLPLLRVVEQCHQVAIAFGDDLIADDGDDLAGVLALPQGTVAAEGLLLLTSDL